MYYWAIIPMLIVLAHVWYCRRYYLFHAMECGLYTWGMRWVVPRIRFSWRHAKLPDWQMMRGFHVLKAGDIILTYSRWQFTSMCIPGPLTHAALCVDSTHARFEIAEMVASGFRYNCWTGLCKASRVVILRCKDWDAEYTQLVIERCETFEGSPYDPRFGFGLKALYCSELIYHSDFEKRVKVDTSDLMGLGRPYVAPQDYIEAENVEVVWDSADEHMAGAA